MWKLPNTGTTIFSVMTALAQRSGAVNLSQGFPDFDPSTELRAHVHNAMMEGANQYAPMPGLMGLREIVADKYREFFAVNVDPETEVTITPGGTAAIFTAIAATVEAGNDVLVFCPAYDSYEPSVQVVGGRILCATLPSPSYVPDWDSVKQLVTNNTRLIVINTPHNPSGCMWSAKDMHELANLCEQLDCYVVSDEVYDLITFNKPHTSVLMIPELRKRSFVINSFGKLVHATGWKVGACIAPPALTNEFRKVHQYINFSVNTPAQTGLMRYLKGNSALHDLSSFLNAKRILFTDRLSLSLWGIRECHGSYFQLLDYSRFWNGSDTLLANRLTTEFKVAGIPLSPFSNGMQTDTALRFCFAKQDNVLIQATELLANAAKVISGERE